MEKAKAEEPREKQADRAAAGKPLIWDCGSSLYDSFELKSFERRLHSAISSRTLSMPHLSDRRIIHPPPSSQPPTTTSPPKKSSSKISRSLQRLVKSVFRPRQSTTNHICRGVSEPSNDGFYSVYDKSGRGALPEIPEYDRISPEIVPFVRRTSSDRFKPASLGISCA